MNMIGDIDTDVPYIISLYICLREAKDTTRGLHAPPHNITNF